MNHLDEQLHHLSQVDFDEGFTRRVMNQLPSSPLIVKQWRTLLMAYAASIVMCVLFVYQSETALSVSHWLGTSELDEEELVEANALGIDSPFESLEE